MSDSQVLAPNPFINLTTQPLVAIQGARNGYLQLAASTATPTYSAMPDSLLFGARAWAQRLEAMGAPRVYWVTLSEVVTHLHIHLYPRWPEDITKGITLFEARDTAEQPVWTEAVNKALHEWATEFDVHLVNPGGKRLMANEAVSQKLYETLAATHVEIIDNSWQHAGHAAMSDVAETSGTHLKITVVSPQFEGVNLIDRHRQVHQALAEAFAAHLHALELKVYSPDEWAKVAV